MKEYGYVPNARPWTKEELEEMERLAKFNKREAKKETFKVIARRVGGPLTTGILAIALTGAILNLKPIADNLNNAQVAQRSEAAFDLYQNAYKNEVSESEKLSAEFDFYNEQKRNAKLALETLEPGTAEYEENMRLINDADKNLMGLNEQAEALNQQSGPRK